MSSRAHFPTHDPEAVFRTGGWTGHDGGGEIAFLNETIEIREFHLARLCLHLSHDGSVNGGFLSGFRCAA